MADTEGGIYPFANLNLAQRLERAEAHSNAGFVEARARGLPPEISTTAATVAA